MVDITKQIAEQLIDCHQQQLIANRGNKQCTSYTEELQPIELMFLTFATHATRSKESFRNLTNQFINNINVVANKVVDDYATIEELKEQTYANQ